MPDPSDDSIFSIKRPVRPYIHLSAEMLREQDEAGSVMQRMCDEIARTLAQQKDNLFRDAISKRLGHENWSIEEIAARMTAITYEWTPATFYLLDREPLIAFWPVGWTPKGDLPEVTMPGEWQFKAGNFENTLSFKQYYKTFEK